MLLRPFNIIAMVHEEPPRGVTRGIERKDLRSNIRALVVAGFDEENGVTCAGKIGGYSSASRSTPCDDVVMC
jgi:hypothetical protein